MTATVTTKPLDVRQHIRLSIRPDRVTPSGDPIPDPPPPKLPSRQLNAIEKRLLASKRVVTAIAKLKQARADFLRVHEENRRNLSPATAYTDALRALKACRRGGDIDKVAVPDMEMLQLAELRAAALIRKEFAEGFAPAAKELISVAREELHDIREDTAAEEAKFLNKFGLGRKETPVSDAVHEVARRLDGFEESIEIVIQHGRRGMRSYRPPRNSCGDLDAFFNAGDAK